MIWSWLEATYSYRVVAGVAFFGVLLAWDLWRHPEDPKRAREYAFLVYAMTLAVLYGVLHDHITVTISPGYFVVGKGLGGSPRHLRWETTLLAAKATYGPGLIAGALILIANNPSKKLESLPYRTLVRLAFLPLGCAALGAVIGGVVSWLAPSASRLEYARELFEKPYQLPFVIVWGVHTGSYVGGGIGTLAAVVWVRRARRRSAPP